MHLQLHRWELIDADELEREADLVRAAEQAQADGDPEAAQELRDQVRPMHRSFDRLDR